MLALVFMSSDSVAGIFCNSKIRDDIRAATLKCLRFENDDNYIHFATNKV